MKARRRAAAAVVLVALALGPLVGCGIPEDSTPREISREALPPELIDPSATATSVPVEGDRSTVTLYLVRANDAGGESLEPVRRSVPLPSDPAEVPKALAEALVAASPALLGRTDVVNALPPDIQIRSAVVTDGGVLDLDLTNLGSVQSALQRLAVAQLVFTLTSLTDPDVGSLRISVDGQEVAVPIEGGVAPPGTPVSRADEPSLLRAEENPTPASTPPSTRGG